MKISIGIVTALLLATSSCIENNIPYPVVPIEVLSVEGVGFKVENGDIDLKNRVVMLRLDETTDISRVVITDVKITDGGTSSIPLIGTLDLRAPVSVVLTLYQNYEWEFQAQQDIVRTFTVEGQTGETRFDLDAHTATAYVTQEADLKNIKVTALKLGPEGITTMDPKMEELTNFTSVRYVDISYHEFHERWKLYVQPSSDVISLKQTDLWQNTAAISVAVNENDALKAELQYRLKGSEQWIATKKGDFEAGILSATIEPIWTSSKNNAGNTIYTLDPASGAFAGRTYEFQLLIDGTQAAQQELNMPAGDVIPDNSMENPALSCFTTSNEASDFWGSGNNTFAKSLCSQGTFNGSNGSYCAKLTASAPVGILAAGNLFSGLFYKEGLTTGVVEFGQPYKWSARPRGMRVKYYAEKVGKVDISKHVGAPIAKGDQDVARIFVAIVDWNARHKVSSGTTAPKGVWDPEQQTSTDEGKIIAYGAHFIDKSSEGGQMIEVELPLNYYDQTSKPVGQFTIAISCSTSAYGDYMVGCQSNILYVDDFEWVY